MKIKNIIKHINVILKHKYYVWKCMKDCGYGCRGLIHDMSKFSLIEFIESVKYFTGTSSPIEMAKKDKGYSDAWFHHRGRNKHHSQYWCDISFGEVIPCKMPRKYLIELICDSVGAGKVYMGDNWKDTTPIEYYKSIDIKSFYHNETRIEIRDIFLSISEIGWEETARNIKDGIISY